MIVLHPGTWCCFSWLVGAVAWTLAAVSPSTKWSCAALSSSAGHRKSIAGALQAESSKMKRRQVANHKQKKKHSLCVCNLQGLAFKETCNYTCIQTDKFMNQSWVEPVLISYLLPAHAPWLTLSTSWFWSMTQEAVSSQLPLNSVF